MDLKTELSNRLEQALAKYLAQEQAQGAEAPGTAVPVSATWPPAVSVEVPRNPDHGDFATNLAMQLARALKRNPMQVAEGLLACLDRAGLVREATIAKPGFINFRLESEAAAAVLRRIAQQGRGFGRTRTVVGTKVLVEFVSANPTGPLHIGHARNAVVGDTVARILSAAGYEVSREYYFNDAGVQMNMLGNTLRLRVAEALGRPVQWPAQYYRGDYMKDIAQLMIREVGAGVLAARLDAVNTELGTNERGGSATDESPSPAGKELDADETAPPAADESPSPAGKELDADETAPPAADETAPPATEGPDAAVDLEADVDAAQRNPYQYFTDFAVREILKTIDADLKAMGIVFDTWFSETTLHKNGSVEATLKELRALDQVYDADGAQWLRTSAHGDEKDRVVVKSNGHYTYITPDIAYHRYKYSRGFDRLINVLGADHHNYVVRLKMAVAALGHPKDALQCVIYQMVSLLKDGRTMKLSTRAGEFITFKEMIDELGAGVVRFFFSMRSPDAQMIFDWNLAKDTSMDNPVYYVQYAHARCRSLFRKAEEVGCPYAGIEGADLSLLTLPGEQAILRVLGRLPEVVDGAARDLAPHYVTNDLQEAAQLFHNWFTQGTNDPSLRFVLPENPALTQARLALVAGLRTVLANGLGILGIEPMERM
jgi:arginyl-tRNA synthetase